ncbi:type VII secretion target [Saccharopolyspora rectivirgula]|uniref:type VII secretion target n=1 Tax=Saccharopolyspora rectivirgula TaxID=28042 RepID=UPI002409A679|nr:type VII secretion target [Saccharopolyspora rectivirgula]
MSDDGFRADVPVIKKHSSEVQEFASRLRTAHSAAQTTMDSNAFGIFGQFIAMEAIALAHVVKSMIQSEEKSLETIKKALDETAADYEATDEESSAIIKGVDVDFA